MHNMDNTTNDGEPSVEMYELGTHNEEAVISTQSDWSSLTVAALKSALSDRGLQTTGRKADLVARLEASELGK